MKHNKSHNILTIKNCNNFNRGDKVIISPDYISDIINYYMQERQVSHNKAIETLFNYNFTINIKRRKIATINNAMLQAKNSDDNKVYLVSYDGFNFFPVHIKYLIKI